MSWNLLPNEIHLMIWKRVERKDWIAGLCVNHQCQAQVSIIQNTFIHRDLLGFSIRSKNSRCFRLWKSRSWEVLSPQEKHWSLQLVFFLFGWFKINYFTRCDFLLEFVALDTHEYEKFYQAGSLRVLDVLNKLEGPQRRFWKDRLANVLEISLAERDIFADFFLGVL
jgi:hypothetical protein